MVNRDEERTKADAEHAPAVSTLNGIDIFESKKQHDGNDNNSASKVSDGHTAVITQPLFYFQSRRRLHLIYNNGQVNIRWPMSGRGAYSKKSSGNLR